MESGPSPTPGVWPWSIITEAHLGILSSFSCVAFLGKNQHFTRSLAKVSGTYIFKFLRELEELAIIFIALC